MSKYDPKIQFLSIGGLNFTHFGEAVASHSREGSFINKMKGIKGEAVTIANYEIFDTFRVTQLASSPHYEQVKKWADYHTQLPLQYKDDNTGRTKSSTTAYIQDISEPEDGKNWEFTVYCEEVK